MADAADSVSSGRGRLIMAGSSKPAARTMPGALPGFVTWCFIGQTYESGVWDSVSWSVMTC